MSLYNMLFGVNPLAGFLMATLGLNMRKVPKFRDCWLDTSKQQIVIMTRTGGANRQHYEKRANTDPEERPTVWNDDLRDNPHYVHDEDDSFDSTYAYFYFIYPDAHMKAIVQIADIMQSETNPPSLEERTKAIIDELWQHGKFGDEDGDRSK